MYSIDKLQGLSNVYTETFTMLKITKCLNICRTKQIPQSVCITKINQMPPFCYKNSYHYPKLTNMIQTCFLLMGELIDLAAKIYSRMNKMFVGIGFVCTPIS